VTDTQNESDKESGCKSHSVATIHNLSGRDAIVIVLVGVIGCAAAGCANDESLTPDMRCPCCINTGHVVPVTNDTTWYVRKQYPWQ
jgi:hypothetical protein